MPREQLQHVVEEADAGPHVVAALAVDRQRARDLRLGRLAIECSRDAGLLIASSLPAIDRFQRFDCRIGVLESPAVTRMQPGVAGSFERSRTWTPRAASASTTGVTASPTRTMHEVRRALPVLEAESLARRVEPLARLRDLCRVSRKELVVLERRQSRRHRNRVDVEGQRHRAHGVERLPAAR